MGLSHRSEPSSDAADCTRAVLPGEEGLNFSISLTRLPHGKPVANAAAAARLLVDAYAEAYAPLLPSPFSFAESGDPGGSSFGPRILVFMLGYRLTADDEGERGSSGVEHPGTSASLLISTPGSFSPSHCLSLRLSMVSRGTRRGGRYVRRGRRQIQRIGASRVEIAKNARKSAD